MIAMAAAGRRDGEAGDYLEVVEAIEDHNQRWRLDCVELFRRVAFSVAVHNTNEQLRNHGFIRTDPGRQLSPAFEINPEQQAVVNRQTGINSVVEAEHEAEALLEFATLCHLPHADAVAVINDVVEAVCERRSLLAGRGIRQTEIAEMGDITGIQLPRLRASAQRNRRGLRGWSPWKAPGSRLLSAPPLCGHGPRISRTERHVVGVTV